jgi:hypothetical protein
MGLQSFLFLTRFCLQEGWVVITPFNRQYHTFFNSLPWYYLFISLAAVCNIGENQGIYWTLCHTFS